MMTMLYGLHSIAAQRGDGLRSEFLEVAWLVSARPVDHPKLEMASSSGENAKLSHEQSDFSAAAERGGAAYLRLVPPLSKG
ncbi:MULTISPECIES: hypothetical protein [unclassified Rhizobium]|jgi:hypothetical protein|uniref:hypothetical protein n=1 Tax=unclassified Rhizobium TaxID=2613769 RepID=UPI000647376E|nr:MULTISPECIES: hypothetical protein [unclassified Rhizobium]MBN8953645.1 hypothetical protein [Rhizobium tropici]OJY79088.1 MAG: hypothetical protein BGP09_24685 [Rhizobium sp. 60-20]RKD67827.1 hypothetical protein BJ928_105230 [Rhizobium sp. WW_1]